MKIRSLATITALLGLVGCGQEEKPEPANSPNLTNVQTPDAQVGLEIGMLAPEIEGEDIDGVQFKLSDYRGKVVVLDFWGNW